jgi:N,N'-diacetyllegionaminate synthase
MRTCIIAEAGVNHNGDLDLACALIDSAVDIGADYIKFQMFTAKDLVTAASPKANYQLKNTAPEESQYEMLERLELTQEMYGKLLTHAKERGIKIFSTAFDLKTIQYLDEVGQNLFKVPSGELTNLPYLRQIGGSKKPIILSTGMAKLGEIESALDVLVIAGAQRENITVLHCNTQYPTAMEDVNLRAMETIRQAFNVSVGYSDHTSGVEVSIAAVALGAVVIEKHLTMDCNLPGPDHKASLEPEAFKAMVSAIRNIEVALGDGCKRPSQGEFENRAIARKSLVAIKAIRSGDILSQDNLGVKRPGNGISPMLWDTMLGKIAVRDYEMDELIEL